jgi:hypothetical protein
MASSEITRTFNAPFESVKNAIDRALGEMGARKVEWSYSGMVATACTPASIWNPWGERLIIAVERSGEVLVCSESLGWVNWGKNRYNCRRLLDTVARRLGFDE